MSIFKSHFSPYNIISVIIARSSNVVELKLTIAPMRSPKLSYPPLYRNIVTIVEYEKSD